ncbi:LysR family transcriptional regulator [Thalassobaculum sp. OXR-137]|uniref:LysR family transcriptional regulator n=1 Tax=Thalassobaculum sp. OXR-137 TaxID=3100173 RepID=UPI002AC8A569|nr:LysR family transcriptional regulator [Thalassobaculum sp. OXR-137]WPZ36584.1 LysR family transcriptional regulator [Thalassobaculum sp. OXR-137]
MNIRHLETLLAIADSGSFAAAAERVGVTQSAVSMQMKTLEEELGAALFDRARRPPVLNDTADGLLPRVRELVRLSEDIRAVAAGTSARGRLRLGIIPTSATGLVPAALARLAVRAPELRIRVESGLSADLLRRVAQGALDAAVVTETPRLERGLVLNPIHEEPLVVAAPIGAAGRSDRDLLRTLPFVRFNRRTGVGRVIDTALRQRRIVVSEAMELDSIEAILAMVSRGLGVAVAPAESVTEELRATVRTVPFGNPAVVRRVALVERERGDVKAATALLLEELRAGP